MRAEIERLEGEVIIVAYVTLVMLHRADGETLSVNPGENRRGHACA